MRNLIFAINTTLDGCVDHTKRVGSDDVLEFHARFLRATTGVQIFGRKTYELMVPYWPDVAKNPAETGPSREFAQAFAAVPKVVFSRTLISVEDPNTRIVRDNLQDAILRLKEEQGKSILVGGVDLASQLIELGLVDEYPVRRSADCCGGRQTVAGRRKSHREAETQARRVNRSEVRMCGPTLREAMKGKQKEEAPSRPSFQMNQAAKLFRPAAKSQMKEHWVR